MCSEIPWGSISGSSHRSVAGAWRLRGVQFHQAVSKVHLHRGIEDGICFVVGLLDFLFSFVLRCTDALYVVSLTGSVFQVALQGSCRDFLPQSTGRR